MRLELVCQGGGIKCCKSEGVISSELVNLAKVGLARGIKWCKSEGVNCSEVVK